MHAIRPLNSVAIGCDDWAMTTMSAEPGYGSAGGSVPLVIDLKGVPQIPQAAHAHMVYEGSEGQGRMDRELQRQCDEAIEAACHVIQHRHLLGLKRRDAGKFTTDEEDDAL
jgi:hypothetical protein